MFGVLGHRCLLTETIKGPPDSTICHLKWKEEKVYPVGDEGKKLSGREEREKSGNTVEKTSNALLFLPKNRGGGPGMMKGKARLQGRTLKRKRVLDDKETRTAVDQRLFTT